MTKALPDDLGLISLDEADALDPLLAGERGRRLAQLRGMNQIVPGGTIVPPDLVATLEQDPSLADRVAASLVAARAPLFALRSSPQERVWGGPRAIINIGMTADTLDPIAQRIGGRSACDLYRRLIQSYGIGVAGLDPEDIENLLYDRLKLSGVEGEAELPEDALRRLIEDYLRLFEDEIGAPFPQSPVEQLSCALRAAARDWHRPTARILREARGAGEDAGLALLVQDMAIGLGPDNSGAGHVRLADERTGLPRVSGRFLANAQGDDAVMGMRTPQLLSRAEREAQGQPGRSLEELHPACFASLIAAGQAMTEGLGDIFDFDFTLEHGRVFILDARVARRSPRAAVRIAVDLAESGAISRDDALLRIEPRSLNQHLHPQIDPEVDRERIGRGLAASPGAASGEIVFSAEAAMARHAQDVSTILVRVETSPEDIRGMHSASGVLTVRGGMTSHAAVIARGLGLPCVVGASDITLNMAARTLRAADGTVFREGELITVDGSSGDALAGAAKTIPAEVTGAFSTLMEWADASRRMRVRANADTPHDARVARDFNADGIGLCRTEQMFFDENRISVMQQMILADDADSRRDSLSQLLPMQRADFEALFEIMHGLPVTIRLLDPPLHEFLPHGADEMRSLARRMDIPLERVIARVDELAEFNPMLGMRGVRLAVTMPEIYEMQARAVFEATVAVNARFDDPADRVVPEIMIPFVSANREVEMVKAKIEAVAEMVVAETGTDIPYRLGVMVETPRAALRAGDLAKSASFLSFGTNDLTQMTYGLSRDDAGRFMRDYVNQGVFAEDPFHALDLEGVGELLMMAVQRARDANPDLSLSVCGEHGGDPDSVRFCDLVGFDYISCSPFRTPIARLAAAQAAILRRQSE